MSIYFLHPPPPLNGSVLKNVGKIETFVHNMVDKLIETVLMHPNYITIN